MFEAKAEDDAKILSLWPRGFNISGVFWKLACARQQRKVKEFEKNVIQAGADPGF